MRHDENKSQACWSFQKPDPCWVIPPHEPEDKHPCVQLDSGDALTPEIDDDTSSAQKLLRRYNLDEMGLSLSLGGDSHRLLDTLSGEQIYS